jgi:hypothetical protein
MRAQGLNHDKGLNVSDAARQLCLTANLLTLFITWREQMNKEPAPTGMEDGQNED